MTTRTATPTVLVIEDEMGINEALQYQFSREGFQVKAATGGLAGLRRFEEGGIDFVVLHRTLDVHIKRLRARVEKDPGRPVHLVTVRGIGYRFNP